MTTEEEKQAEHELDDPETYLIDSSVLMALSLICLFVGAGVLWIVPEAILVQFGLPFLFGALVCGYVIHQRFQLRSRRAKTVVFVLAVMLPVVVTAVTVIEILYRN